MLKKLCSTVVAVTLFSTLAVGCQPARKPAPAPAPKTAPNRVAPAPARKPAPVAPAPTTMPTTSKDVHKLATKLAAEAAKVKGVNKATVALSNTVAYVGLDLNPNIEGAKTNTIKKEAADRVKKADKRLTRVYVSTDVGVVTRIKKVAKGVQQGKPVSTFAKELAEIGRRIVP